MAEEIGSLWLFLRFCTKELAASADELQNASEGGASSEAQWSTAAR